MRSVLGFVLIGILSSLIWGLPPYISIEQRFQESPLVIVGVIHILRKRQLFPETNHITLMVRKQKILKNIKKLSVPDSFYIYINIYPETFENKLKFVPEEGKYIIFLEPIIKNDEIVVYKLYREEPFALEPWSKEKEQKILFDIQK